jgi:hypothetical protein
MSISRGLTTSRISAWSTSLLRYVDLTVDATGKLNVTTAAGGGGGADVQYVEGDLTTPATGTVLLVRNNAGALVALPLTAAGALTIDGSGVTQPVSAVALPLPSGAATEATLAGLLAQTDFDTKTGSLTEAAPATDTASSGLNGRLQRIAQRITSLLGLFPSALTGSGNFKVAIVESTASQAVTGPLTDAQLRANAVPVSLAAVVHVDDNTGSLTIDSANLDVALSTRLKPADTLTKVATVDTITNVVHVDDNAGSLTVDGTVTANQGTAAAGTAPWPHNWGVPAQSSGNLINNGDTLATTLSGMSSIACLMTLAADIASGANIFFEASVDNASWNAVYGYIWKGTPTGGVSSYSFNVTLTTTATSTPTLVIIALPAGITNFRLRRGDANAGTVAAKLAPGATPVVPPLTALAPNQSVNVAQIGANNTTSGNGSAAVGTQRVTVANDSTGTIIPWDGTTKETVKAASTASVAGDTSLVVQLSPNSLVESVPSGGFGNTALRVFVNAIRKATYYASARNISTGALVANTNKAVLSLDHANTSTKTVRIRCITVSGIVSTAGGAAISDVAFAFTRGTAQNTGGGAVTPGLANAAQAAADTTVKSLPTIVAATAISTTGVIWAPAAGLAAGTLLPRTVIYDWSEAGSVEPLIIRSGQTESIVINIISTNTPTLSLSLDVEFTEE